MEVENTLPGFGSPAQCQAIHRTSVFYLEEASRNAYHEATQFPKRLYMICTVT